MLHNRKWSIWVSLLKLFEIEWNRQPNMTQTQLVKLHLMETFHSNFFLFRHTNQTVSNEKQLSMQNAAITANQPVCGISCWNRWTWKLHWFKCIPNSIGSGHYLHTYLLKLQNSDGEVLIRRPVIDVRRMKYRIDDDHPGWSGRREDGGGGQKQTLGKRQVFLTWFVGQL